MRTFCSPLLLALFVASSAQGQVSTAVGTWRVKTEFGSRTRISMLQLERAASGVTGRYFWNPGESTELQNVLVEGDRMTFDVIRRFGGQPFAVRYEARISKDALSGTAEWARGERSHRWNWTAERSDPAELNPKDEAPPVSADIELTAENYQVWRDHILPDQSEMAWAEIPWLTTFKDGILAADAANKPLLLWTMNGHPLGCT